MGREIIADRLVTCCAQQSMGFLASITPTAETLLIPVKDGVLTRSHGPLRLVECGAKTAIWQFLYGAIDIVLAISRLDRAAQPFAGSQFLGLTGNPVCAAGHQPLRPEEWMVGRP